MQRVLEVVRRADPLEARRTELPWLPPYRTGELIDALLLAGGINEATAAAADFHAAHEGPGWDVAVALSALVRSVAASARRGVVLAALRDEALRAGDTPGDPQPVPA